MIISELNKIVTTSFIMNNKHEKIKIYSFSYFIIFIMFAFFLIAAVFLHHARRFKKLFPSEINLYYVLSILLLLSIIGFVFGLTLHNHKHASILFTTIEETIQTFITHYISYLNVYFKDILEWKYYDDRGTIEIRICNDDEEDDEIRLSHMITKVDHYKEKKRQNETLKKIEEILEDDQNEEENQLIYDKLYNEEAWKEHNYVDCAYMGYEEEECEDEENEFKQEKEELNEIDNQVKDTTNTNANTNFTTYIRTQSNNIQMTRSKSKKDLLSVFKPGSLSKSSQMIIVDRPELVSGDSMRLINCFEDNVTTIIKQKDYLKGNQLIFEDDENPIHRSYSFS